MAPAPVWSDVTTFNGRPWRGLVDGLIGGIPCQPHSLAGRRGGEDDERDLWSPTRRIIVQARPWWVLIENVPGMLSAKPGQVPGAKRLWRDLQRLGYQIEGGLFAASEVGASHKRERFFGLAVADAAGLGGGGSGLCEAGSIHDGTGAAGGDPAVVNAEGQRQREGLAQPVLRGRGDTSTRAGSPVADTFGGLRDGGTGEPGGGSAGRGLVDWARSGPLFPPGPDDLDGWRAALEQRPELEPAVRGVPDGMGARVDKLRLLGNGVVPLQAAYALRTLAARLAARGSAGAGVLVRMMG